MIRAIVAAAWSQSPSRTVVAVALTPIVVVFVWVLLVVGIVALS